MRLTRRDLLTATGVVAGSAAAGAGLRSVKANSPPRLRPPGAGSEDRFLARCIRCAQCIKACPTDVLLAANAFAGLGMGTPYVVARQQPCDLCQGRGEMKCIEACPTEALQPLADRRDVRMGIAVIDADTCLPFQGVSCKACWHACPFPRDAIAFDQLGRPLVVAEECVGCGLCEYACLTNPTSIRIRSHSEDELAPNGASA